MKPQIVRQLALCLSSFVVTMTAVAQDFPGKLVNLVVPYQAGGGSDFAARVIQPEYQKRLGQTVIVENLAGASGAIGAQKVLTSRSDGHTQLLGSPFESVLVPLSLKSVTYKPEDFRLVSLVSMLDVGLMVRKDIPASTVDEFVAWARTQPRVTYGSVGPGSLFHLMGVQFAAMTGLNMIHVPYRGVANVVADLSGGQIDVAFMTFLGPTVGGVKDGRFKALGVASSRRLEVFPDLPNINKSKGLERFNFETWVGVMVPKSTPEPAVRKAHAALSEVLKIDQIRKSIQGSGAQVPPRMTTEELDAYYKREIDLYRGIFAASNIERQ